MLRAVFKNLDVSTTSTITISGPIGKTCEKDYHDLPQVQFSKTTNALSHIEIYENKLKDLNSDQRPLYEYVFGVSKVQVKARYAAWKVSPLNRDKWLILATRIM